MCVAFVIVGVGLVGVCVVQILLVYGVWFIVIDEVVQVGGQIYCQLLCGFLCSSKMFYGFEVRCV